MQDTLAEQPIHTTQFTPERSTLIVGEPTQDMLSKFVPTGISVKVDLPIIKDEDTYLFAINVDGWIPFHSLMKSRNPTYWANCMKNFFPVQLNHEIATSESQFVKIFYEHTSQPAQLPYWTNRCMTGNVGIALRMSSNTSQTGNLIISHKSALLRRYRKLAFDEKYYGLDFQNDDVGISSTFSKTFSLVDISLQRHISIATTSTKSVPFMDIPMKLKYLNLNYNNEWLEDLPDRKSVV